MKRVIVAHPGKQHSFETAMAFQESKELIGYLTTVYDKAGSFTRRLSKVGLSEKDKKKAKSRYCEKIPDEKVFQFCEIRMLLQLFLLRIPKLVNFYRKYSRWVNKAFGEKVAKFAIKNNADVVIMYDTTALSCFEYLETHAPNIIRILDVTIATRQYAKDIYDEERRQSQNEDIYLQNKYIWDSKIMNDYVKEAQYAHYCLAASSFVVNSLSYIGITEDKIYKIPYGVNVNRFMVNGKKDIKQECPIKFVFVGQINARKGIPHLLKVMERFSENEVELYIVGNCNKTNSLYLEYSNKNNIHFTGFMIQDELRCLYEEADVFVLPSLCEGMAMVGFEAMSMELPIICSNNSGINDLIDQYKNGIVFCAGNDDELYEAIKWMIDNRYLLRDMGKNARKTAEKYTWKRYRRTLTDTINSIEV